MMWPGPAGRSLDGVWQLRVREVTVRGFVAGILTDDIDPDKLLGSLFQPLVSLAVR
jgi:hypothetical protein